MDKTVVSLETFLQKHGLIQNRLRHIKPLLTFLAGAFITLVSSPIWLPVVKAYLER